MSVDAPPRPRWAWRLMGTILVGMAAGYATASALGFGRAGVESAIVCSLTFTAGGAGRLRTAVPVAAVLGAVVVVYSTIGALTTGFPVASALAMAAVAFTTTVMTSAKPVGLLIGMVASYAYFLVTAVGVIAREAVGADLGQVGLLGLVGLATGLVLVTIRGLIEEALGTAPASKPRTDRPSLLAPMIASVRTFDAISKDGIRRAIALGLAMFGFQYFGSHNAFWVMLSVYVIMQPNGRSTVASAARRVLGTVVGVVAVVALTAVLPISWALPLAILALAISLALSTRSTWLSAAFGAGAAAVLVGLPGHDIVTYAGARLIDTVVGSALALVASFVLWPRSTSPQAQVPDDLAGDAATSGMG